MNHGSCRGVMRESGKLLVFCFDLFEQAHGIKGAEHGIKACDPGRWLDIPDFEGNAPLRRNGDTARLKGLHH